MNRILMLGLSLCILAGIALAQSDMEPESPCIAGALWHDAQAYHWLNNVDQEWHFRAAQALEDAADHGGTCDNWQQDATRPGIDGRNDVASQDALGSQAMQAGAS